MSNADPSQATREEVEQQIKLWRDAREARLAHDKVGANLKRIEDQRKSFVLEAFKLQRWEGMIIGGRSVGLTIKETPVVTDREAFSAYILETQDLSLLEFRPSKSAIEERECEVPGTEYVEVYDLWDRKA